MSAHHGSQFAGVGGPSIFWQSWLPDGKPRAVLTLSHGLSEHSDRYGHVAGRLVGEGYAVYALDHRGHGRSEGPRALIDRIDNAADDLGSLIGLATGEHPQAKLFLLGHSVGGTIALWHALRAKSRPPSGLILSGPLAALEAASTQERIAARALSMLFPRAPLIAIDASLISRDPAVVQAYVDDPLVHHGKVPARTVVELANAIEAFPEAVGGLTLPTLIMYGTADRLCPTHGSVMLGERIGSADVTLKAYDDLYHEILNEPEQELVLDDLCSWLAARSAPVAA